MALLPWNTQRQSGAEHFQAVSALTHIHQLVANELTRVLRPHGLTQTAFQLMATLLISPEQRRGMVLLGTGRSCTGKSGSPVSR